jgi:hypothetical protein
MQKVRLLAAQPADAPTRRSAFVDFGSLDASASALKLSGTSLLGRVLAINYSGRQEPPASSKPKRSEGYLARRKEKREAKLKERGAFTESSPFKKARPAA